MDSVWLWVGFVAFVLVLLALDLGVLHKGEKQITVRHALYSVLLMSALPYSLQPACLLLLGETAGYQFLTGYLIEKSLSVDNIFVFVLIFTHFAVPPQYQYPVLFWGILGALVMRATLILVGAAVIEAFHWVICLFGAFLIFTGIKMLITVGQEPNIDNNRIAAFMRRHFRVSDDCGKQVFRLARWRSLHVARASASQARSRLDVSTAAARSPHSSTQHNRPVNLCPATGVKTTP